MLRNNKGFTLIEMLVAMAVAGLAMSAIYTTYNSQQKSYVVQQEIAIMQQNLRAGMQMLMSELRMAGFDPTGKADAGIETADDYTDDANQSVIRFTRDDNEDGDVTDSGEDLTYSLYTSSNVQKLGRKNPSTNMPVAEYIDKFHLHFLDDDNSLLNVTTANIGDIRSVQITIVGQSANYDPDYSNAFTYQDLQGNSFTIAADGYRRAVLSAQVQCRNLGL